MEEEKHDLLQKLELETQAFQEEKTKLEEVEGIISKEEGKISTMRLHVSGIMSQVKHLQETDLESDGQLISLKHDKLVLSKELDQLQAQSQKSHVWHPIVTQRMDYWFLGSPPSLFAIWSCEC